jgi:hypothetical protein
MSYTAHSLALVSQLIDESLLGRVDAYLYNRYLDSKQLPFTAETIL